MEPSFRVESWGRSWFVDCITCTYHAKFNTIYEAADFMEDHRCEDEELEQ